MSQRRQPRGYVRAFSGDLTVGSPLAEAPTKRRYALPIEPPAARWPPTDPTMLDNVLRGLRNL